MPVRGFRFLGRFPVPQSGTTLRRAMGALTTWPGRVLLGLVGAFGALFAVYRATQPDVPGLTVQRDIAAVDASESTFVRALELYTRARFEPGNRVDVLLNGRGTYPLLWQDLRSAERTIVVQSYYSKPGAMADTLARILIAKALAGVGVYVLLDAFGSQAMPESWLRELRRNGVHVAMLRPLRWHTLHGAADRSHVRALVVDGRVGYTGGFGFADYWGGDGRAADEWRETNVRVAGPAAAQLQAAFAAGWHEATGELLTSRDFLPPAEAIAAGPSLAGVLLTRTATGTTDAERFIVLALLSARRSLLITNSYFVPNADLRRLLREAVDRGVDVRILTAGPGTDVKTTRFAGRHHYEELLRAGVRIYEYDASMMHAKTLSVDGVWSAIGSMNFDSRSLAFNDESTLLVRDRAVAARMEVVFSDDLAHAREISLDEFLRRSRWERMLEAGANLLAALL